MTTMCDQPLCAEQATHAYTWDWGQSGAVCAKHQALLQQTSENLGRKITFSPIDPAATPVLTRDERVKLKAESLVLAEELTEAKARGLDMYRQIELLTAQVQSLTVRNREAEAQLKDLANANAKSEERQRRLEAENGDLADELGRLRVLLPPPGRGEIITSATTSGAGGA